MNNIIVPTDFSSTAGAALRYAHLLAEATGCSLEVLHVHDGYGHAEGPRVKKGSLEARMNAQRAIDDFVRFQLAANQAVAAGEGEETAVAIRSTEATGSPTSVLIAASQKETTRLIVMGGVGSGRVSAVSPFFGSVARTVAEGAACPVLLVPQEHDSTRIERVAIAFNVAQGLRESSNAFDFLRVALSPAMRFVHVRDFSQQAEARKEIALMEEVLNTSFPNYPVELDLLDPGDITVRLLEYIEEEAIDLLVMGHRSPSLLKRILHGSTIKPVLRFSNTPMLIVPVSDY